MLAPSTVLLIVVNAVVVAIAALAWHELIRPGKLLSFVASWLSSREELLRLHAQPYTCIGCDPQLQTRPWRVRMLGVFRWLTYGLRECFACLAGQIAVLYGFAVCGVPHGMHQWTCAVAFVATAILITYPLNNLKNGRR